MVQDETDSSMNYGKVVSQLNLPVYETGHAQYKKYSASSLLQTE